MHSALNTLWHHFIPSKHNAYRPHILRRPWLLFFLSLALTAEGFLVANLLVRQSSEVFLAAVVPGEIIAITNTERAQNQVSTLVEDVALGRAAQAKAEDMANKGYFAHVGPGGVEPWSWIMGVGYDYKYAGENLAVQFVDSSEVVDAWMESPTHRANIVKPAYTAVGVGVAHGLYEGQRATYVVQYFATPRNPHVEQGASVGAAQTTLRTFTEALQRQFVRLMSEPQSATAWALGSIAAVLLVAVLLGFFVHMQIQPTAMLVSGTTLAVFALLLIVVNGHFLQMSPPSPAAVAGAPVFVLPQSGVVIDEEALSTQR